MRTKEASRAHTEKMEVLVRRWRKSGKTQSQFFREEGIRPHLLSYWQARFPSKPTGVGFVELQSPVISSERPALLYEIATSSGTVIRLRDGFDISAVKHLIAGLTEAE